MRNFRVPTVERLKLMAAWFSGATFVLVVSFLVMRMYPVIEDLIPWITGLMSATLALAAGAAWTISSIYNQLNQIATQYDQAKHRYTLLKVAKAKIVNLLGKDDSRDGGRGVLRPTVLAGAEGDGVAADVEVGLSSERVEVNLGRGATGLNDGAVSPALKPTSPTRSVSGMPVKPAKPRSKSTSRKGKLGSQPRDTPQGKPKPRPNRRPLGGSLLSIVLLVFVLGGCSVQAQTPAMQYATSDTGDPCPFDTVVEYLDRSGSMNNVAFEQTLQALSETPWLGAFCGLRLWALHPWATALDAVMQPTVKVPIARASLEQCGEDAGFLAVVVKECRRRNRAAFKQVFGPAYQELAAQRHALDLTNTIADKTCLSAIFQRAASAPAGTLNLILTDGIQAGCGQALGSPEPLVSKGGTTVLILLPNEQDGNDVMDAMKQRKDQLRAMFPELIVVPSYQVDERWTWLAVVLEQAETTPVSARKTVKVNSVGLRP